MKPNIKMIHEAKKLAKLSFMPDGEFVEQRAKFFLEEINNLKKNKIYIKNLLNLFLKYLGIELKKSELTIEYAGEFSENDIKKIHLLIEKRKKRKLLLSTKRNDQLIAGIKMSVGDIVLENSIRNDINSL